jgi:hypothetical protein
LGVCTEQQTPKSLGIGLVFVATEENILPLHSVLKFIVNAILDLVKLSCYDNTT